MKIINALTILLLTVVVSSYSLKGENKSNIDHIKLFKETLQKLADQTSIGLFKNHFQAMKMVIDAQQRIISRDTAWIVATIPAFTDSSMADSPLDFSTYLNRKKPLIIAWVSPAHPRVTSLSWLKLPKDWDPQKSYPLYVDLHGLWKVCDFPLNYMTYPYRNTLVPSFAYEDGYLLSPWGRGNQWYINESELDINEAVDYAMKILPIDKSRVYITGHSMGGFGAWHIAGNTPHKWAAVGIHAGALAFGDNTLADEKLNVLCQLPIYIVVGTNDSFYEVNKQAVDTLRSLGAPNIEFVTFNGGHTLINKNIENMYLWLREFKNPNTTNSNLISNSTDNQVTIFPNPINAEISFRINLSKPQQVSFTLFDNLGKKAATIINSELESGASTLTWKRENLPPGIYFYSLAIGKQIKNGKLLFL